MCQFIKPEFKKFKSKNLVSFQDWVDDNTLINGHIDKVTHEIEAKIFQGTTHFAGRLSNKKYIDDNRENNTFEWIIFRKIQEAAKRSLDDNVSK